MKELKKMNLNELKTLSRREMKNVMAGSGGRTCACISLNMWCVSPIQWGNCDVNGYIGQLCCSL